MYPDLPLLEAKRRLAQDLLWSCRLTDEDGRGGAGWLAHVRALARRATKLTRLGLTALDLRGPGTHLTVRLAPGTRWLGGQEETPWGVKIAPNMPTEETFTSPHAAGTEGAFACTFPLSFQGRLIDGLRGEFRGGRGLLIQRMSDSRQGGSSAFPAFESISTAQLKPRYGVAPIRIVLRDRRPRRDPRDFQCGASRCRRGMGSSRKW